MRDFFIRALESLIGLLVILMMIAVLIGSFAVMSGGVTTPNGTSASGIVPGFALLVAGALYVIVVGGFMYLGIGIYHNTKRAAEAMERMAGK